MNSLAKHHPLVLNKPASIARIDRFEANSIVCEWHVWHQDYNERYRAKGELQEQLWYALNRDNPSQTFPVQPIELLPRHRTTPHPQASRQNHHEASQQLLKNNPLFEHLTDDHFLHIIHQSPIRSYGPGETIVAENDCGDSLFLVLEGTVLISKRTSQDTPIKVTKPNHGEIFGEMTLLTSEPLSASAQCITNADVMEVNSETLATLIEQEPALLQKIGQLISERKATLASLQEEQSLATSPRDTINQMHRLFASLLK